MTTKILRIAATRDGFRRAGIAHPAAPVDHPRDRFTAEQIEILKAENMLIVQEIDGEAAPPPATPAAGAPTGLARAEAIAAAVRQLDPASPKHFTKGGEPKVDAIAAIAGFEISGDEREAAWATVHAEREATGKTG